MTTWNIIPDADVDAESPITESLMFRMRDNPMGVAESDASVPYANLVLVEGTRTDENDAGKLLRPDGAGLVEWVDTNSTSQYICQAKSLSSGATGTISNTTKKAFNIDDRTEVVIAGVGENDESPFAFPSTPSIGSVYMSAHDTGTGNQRVWAADCLSISFDDPSSPTTFTTTWFSLYTNNAQSPPTTVTDNTDDNWHTVHSMVETGSIGNAGTWTILEQRSDGDYVYFRCRCRTDGGGDSSQSSFSIQVKNFG